MKRRLTVLNLSKRGFHDLRFSIAGTAVGLDWLRLKPDRLELADRFVALAAAGGHTVRRIDNGEKVYYRAEGGDSGVLCRRCLVDIFQVEPDLPISVAAG